MVLINRAIGRFSLTQGRPHDDVQDFAPLIGKQRGQRVRGGPEVFTQQQYGLREVGSGESRGNLLGQRFIFLRPLIFAGAAGDTVITKMENAKAQAGGYVRNL